MKLASMSPLSAALMLALATSVGANEEQNTTSALAANPTSSTATGNTAQRTAEGATARSFESEIAQEAQAQAATAPTSTAGSASAETTSATALAGAAPTFEALDGDRDGFIARTELPAGHALAGAWSRYDADNDQRLARGDFDRWISATYPDFATLDTNRDGTLSMAELPSSHALYVGFASYDVDGDAKLSRSEFDAWAPDGRAVAQADGSDAVDTAGETEDQPE